MNAPSGTIIGNPVLHDKSDAIRFGSPTAGVDMTAYGAWLKANYGINLH